MALTTDFQGFEGGTVGAAIDWNSSDATGAPVWLAGAGTALFTDQEVSHGSRAAIVTNGAGQSWAALVYSLPDSTVEARWHVYVRMPDAPIRRGFAYVSLTGDVVTWTFYLNSDHSVSVIHTGGAEATIAPAGSIPAGAVFRIGFVGGVDTTNGGGQYGAAAFQPNSASPIGEVITTFAGANTLRFSNVQMGLVGTSDPNYQSTTTLDSFRVESGTAPGDVQQTYLPPEPGGRVSRTWVLIDDSWVRLDDSRTRVPVNQQVVATVYPSAGTYPSPALYPTS